MHEANEKMPYIEFTVVEGSFFPHQGVIVEDYVVGLEIYQPSIIGSLSVKLC